MNMRKGFMNRVILLCGIFLALCALPRTVMASVLDDYSDGKVYDVTAYGADSTGSSSSSTAVASAISQARKDLNNGNMDGKSRAVIYFPSGTYKLSDGFRLYSKMAIAAESDTAVQASGTAVDIFNSESTSIEGGIWSSSGSDYVIKDNGSDLTLKNVAITKAATGFLFYNAQVTMESCSASGCTEAGIQSSLGTLALNNVTVSDSKIGIVYYNTEGTISNCSASGCTEVGIQNSKGKMTVKDVTVSDCTTGFGFYNSAKVTVEDCSVTGCTDMSVQNTKGTLELKNVVISGSNTGIGAFNSTVTMDGVTVTGCTNLGMNIANKSKVTAQNITVKSNGSGYPKKDFLGHGIGVYSKATFTVSDSTISGNRECGISLSAGNAEIKNCVMENNGRHAVGTDKVCSLKMSGCKVNKNGLKDTYDGISVVEGSKATITNCTITSSGTTGLLITGAGTTATVKNCTFKGNKSQNIYIENLESGKVTVTVNGGKFYKTKSSYSIRVHVNKTSQYSLKLKGSIKYYNKVKKGYTLWMGKKMVHKKK